MDNKRKSNYMVQFNSEIRTQLFYHWIHVNCATILTCMAVPMTGNARTPCQYLLKTKKKTPLLTSHIRNLGPQPPKKRYRLYSNTPVQPTINNPLNMKRNGSHDVVAKNQTRAIFRDRREPAVQGLKMGPLRGTSYLIIIMPAMISFCPAGGDNHKLVVGSSVQIWGGT